MDAIADSIFRTVDDLCVAGPKEATRRPNEDQF